MHKPLIGKTRLIAPLAAPRLAGANGTTFPFNWTCLRVSSAIPSSSCQSIQVKEILVAFSWVQKKKLQHLELSSGVFLVTEICKMNHLSTAAATDSCMAKAVQEELRFWELLIGSENCSWVLYLGRDWLEDRLPGFESQAPPLHSRVNLASDILSLWLFPYLQIRARNSFHPPELWKGFNNLVQKKH